MAEKPKRGIGRPFPKGVSGNPLGRRKVDPVLMATLEAGNMGALERLWKLMHSKNERIALTAAMAWLLKTVPNAEKLELTGGGGGPIQIEAIRDKLATALSKRFAAKVEQPAEPPKALPETT